MPTPEKTKILCVDDEPQVLEGMALHLGRTYQMVTATNGRSGLEALAKQGPFAAVLSDMRMPIMDGAAFLGQVRKLAPDTVRMLLTGHADLQAAIAAVNEGQLFRFLTKPCPPFQLVASFRAAVEQYELIISERVLLEQTLRGSIKALLDVMALTSPAAFGRTERIRTHVAELAEKRGLRGHWQVEVAAMVSQLGCMALPPETVEKVYYAQKLTDKEQAMVARMPAITEQILVNIPRLDGVRAILAGQRTGAPYSGEPANEKDPIGIGIAILRIASDFEDLETQGFEPAAALDAMRGRKSYDPDLLEAFAATRGATSKGADVRELPILALKPGMVIAEDVRTHAGILLVPRGYTVTSSFIERLKNYPPGTVREPILLLNGNRTATEL
jgi:response regulator RpfG family c-di-GMP phosphodiesterase